jgi:N-acyl-D-aspartate/D-glutamate deacylase
MADVVVRGGHVIAVEPGYRGEARKVIDARDHIVAPGFIDIETHSDFTLPLYQGAESRVHQGVTTEVVGSCGFTLAPALPFRAGLLEEYLAAMAPGLEIKEHGFAEYLDSFPPTAVNTIMQVGHNTLRLMVMGMEDRPPTAYELALMQHQLEEALEAGALGLSSGLFTPPGAYAERDELLALARVLRRHEAGYATHLRDEAGGILDAVREAVDLGERTGVHVQIVHLKLSGTDNWGGAPRLLAELEAARTRGVPVDCDQYPYTTAVTPLRAVLPPWVHEGGIRRMLARLADVKVRVDLRAEIGTRGLRSLGRISSWDAVRISHSPASPDDVGRTIREIAARHGADPLDTLCDLLLADSGTTRVLVDGMHEDDVRAFLAAPWVLVGSDGRSVAPRGPLAHDRPHPRFYGAFPRVLGRYVRDLGLLTLPQAVYKMTGGAATALGLVNRGLLRPGYAADITVFDAATIDDQGSYEDPERYPSGVAHVIVNGVVVVEAGMHTGALPGRVLRRGPAGVA